MSKTQQQTALPVGTIVTNSWGYDQTNVDFYEVVAATTHFVTMRKLNQITTETGFMSGTTVPILKSYADTTTIRRKVHAGFGNGPIVSMSYGNGYVWNGQPQSCSWYA